MILPQESQQEYNIKVNTERSGRIEILWRKGTGDVQIQRKNTRNGSFSRRRDQRTLGIPFFFVSIHPPSSMREYFDSLHKIAQVCRDEKGASEANFARC